MAPTDSSPRETLACRPRVALEEGMERTATRPREEGAAGALEGIRLLVDMFPESERARERLAETVDAANAD